jgi:hypothetical protein
MVTTDPVLIDLPMPIRTPRLTIRPKQVGDGAIAFSAVQCDTGFWVRKSAQGQGIATETANAMVCYAFGALGMQRVGFTHSLGNEPSRRIAERLGFALEGIQQKANLLPGGKAVDRYCYARFDVTGLPELEVTWKGVESNRRDKITSLRTNHGQTFRNPVRYGLPTNRELMPKGVLSVLIVRRFALGSRPISL